MQNNISPKIALQTGANKKSRFNLSHDVTTTFDFGTTQPVLCQEMIPGSKATLDMQALFRASPLVAPTFGRQKVEYRSFFVPIQSIMRHFQDSFLSQKAVAEGKNLIAFNKVPSLPAHELLSYMLVGSRCSIYSGGSGASNAGSVALSLSNSNTRSTAETLIRSLIQQNYIVKTDAINNDVGPYHGATLIDIKKLLNIPVDLYYIPIASDVHLNINGGYENVENGFFFGSPDSSVNDGSDNFDYGAVPLETADYIISKTITVDGKSSRYVFAFSLSDAGKRLRKILLGLGYQTDLMYDEELSLLPLFAYYMAYFDAFGLERFENFQTTNCAKCLTYYNNTGLQPAVGSDNKQNWRGFIYDLMNCWATQPQDFVGSIQDTVTISPSAAASYAELIDVNGAPAIVSSDTSNDANTQQNGHSYINNILHGELDSQLLKRLYRWVNRNTVVGKRVEDLLRAQGLGSWIDQQKTHFVGKHEIILSIDDVSAMADTFQQVGNADTGSRLGAYAGKCVDFSKSRTISYDTNDFGYLITIAVLIPEGGYCQALQSHVLEKTKFDFYHPEFDSLGHEAVTFGETVFCNPQVYEDHIDHGNNAETFGFAPRYMTKKVKPNIQNGDINLPSTQNGYLPFTLDKLIFAQKAKLLKVSNSSNGQTAYNWKIPMAQNHLPNASLAWRFYNKYPFLSNYNRIFFNSVTEYYRTGWPTWEGLEKNEVDFTMESRSDDNWICHQVNNLQYYAPMLPISESFGTFDDDEKAPVMTVGKT